MAYLAQPVKAVNSAFRALCYRCDNCYLYDKDSLVGKTFKDRESKDIKPKQIRRIKFSDDNEDIRDYIGVVNTISLEDIERNNDATINSSRKTNDDSSDY